MRSCSSVLIGRETFSRHFEFREFLHQCFQIGYKSLPLVSITGAIMGLVLTIQSRPVLVDFGAETMLPGMVAVSLIREMGPVITALICAGKVGSGMGAELGSMRVTEQIDAMEVSSTNPVRFLVVTRVLAAILMIPLLTLYADALGILGSWAGANIKGDVGFTLFMAQAFKVGRFHGPEPRHHQDLLLRGGHRHRGLLQGLPCWAAAPRAWARRPTLRSYSPRCWSSSST
jgi:phospholipid/cholesterol/gamma-HCH transport system permease protein